MRDPPQTKAKEEIALPAIGKRFPLFEKTAKDNGSNGHFVGDSLTFVDVYIADRIVTIDGMLPGFADAYPSVIVVMDKVISDPRLKEWIATRGTRRVAGEVVDLRK